MWKYLPIELFITVSFYKIKKDENLETKSFM